MNTAIDRTVKQFFQIVVLHLVRPHTFSIRFAWIFDTRFHKSPTKQRHWNIKGYKWTELCIGRTFRLNCLSSTYTELYFLNNVYGKSTIFLIITFFIRNLLFFSVQRYVNFEQILIFKHTDIEDICLFLLKYRFHFTSEP